jgi:hypothetical protein
MTNNNKHWLFSLSTIILFILVNDSCQSGFAKNLDLNVVFPPILERREGLATGHLRPLGWQNRAQASVHEELHIRPIDFWNLHINHSKPLVVRGLVFGSEPIDKWNDAYLNRIYGHLDIKVTQRKQRYAGVEEKSTQMSFKKFLKGYRVEDWYMRVIMPQEMQKEAPMPSIVNCGPLVHSKLRTRETTSDASQAKSSSSDIEQLKKLLGTECNETSNNNDIECELPRIAQLIEPYLWISAGETSSLLHSHPEHNLHCLLDGRKDFILIPIEQFEQMIAIDWRTSLDLHETFEHSNEWYSKIDVDMVNAYKYKLLGSVVWHWASLRAGDCIYIPANYLHQVRSHGRSISSSIYFTTIHMPPQQQQQQQQQQTNGSSSSDEATATARRLIKDHLYSQCDLNMPLFEPMIQRNTSFLWTYTHSERHLNNKNIGVKEAKNYLLYLIKSDSKLYYERFSRFYNELTAELREKNKPEDFENATQKFFVHLDAAAVWSDFFSESDRDQKSIDNKTPPPSFMSHEHLFKLNETNLSRFVTILNKVANYHEQEAISSKPVRDEL